MKTFRPPEKNLLNGERQDLRELQQNEEIIIIITADMMMMMTLQMHQ